MGRVVGKNIAYNAIGSKDCKNWAWDLQDGHVWHPTGGTLKQGTSMKLPTSDLAGITSASWFGKAYGTVDVWCVDGEGNTHQFTLRPFRAPQKRRSTLPRRVSAIRVAAASPTGSTTGPPITTDPALYKFGSTESYEGGVITFVYSREHYRHRRDKR